MDVENLRSALKEVISRYDADEDGQLSPKEAFCFLQAFWGVGYSPGHVQLVHRLYTNPNYEAQDVEMTGDEFHRKFSGQIPFRGMMKFCEDELTKSEELQQQAFNSLISHGYELDTKKGRFRLKITDPTHETYQTLCLRLVQKQLNDPSNFFWAQWLVEVSNSMIEYRERPNKKLMKILSETQIFGDSEAHWDNMEADWKLEELIARGDYLEKTGLKWSKKFIGACKEIFSRYDGDDDGKLSKDEMRLFRGVLSGRLPTHALLERHMKHPSLETIIEEALENKFQRKSLVKFVFWHGYDANLRLLPDTNREPITQESLIFRLCRDIEDKKSRNVKFEVDLLSDFIRLTLYEEEEKVPQPGTENLSAIASILGLRDLQDIFKLKSGEYKAPTNHEDAFQLFLLTFRYVWKMEWIESTPKPLQITFMRNAEEAIYNYVELQPMAFVDFLSSKEILERLKGIQSVKNYLDQKVGDGGRRSIIPQIIESLSFREGFTGIFGQFWEIVDPAELVLFAVRLSKAVLYPGSFRYDVIINLLRRLDDNAAKSVLESIVEQNIAAREFVDFYYCWRFNEPYPDILPEEAELSQMTAEQITKRLADYCGVPQEKVDDHFMMYKLIAPNQLIGATILEYAKQLQALGVDRKTVAKKFAGLLEMAVKFPFRVAKCDTSGHHPDAFHPTHGDYSYYIKTDMVGGAADCLIINMTLLSEEHRDEVTHWTYEDMQNLLIARLNAPKKAEWEEWDGVLYCSDMNPYLIRVACCFEGEGTRYRVDVTKLCRILDLL